VLGKAKRGKRISNIQHSTANDEGRKEEDTAVGWKEITIIDMVHEDHHGPKGTSPKSGLENAMRNAEL
jgi:hypothetical protein